MPERAAAFDALRKPFPSETVGKLPRLTCQACSKSSGKVCPEHRKNRCQACGNYISTAHIDLDYVGHAVVTDRLLAVDPTWTWEPAGTDDRGLPAFDKDGGLWIRLTVNGVTRLGYGDGPDPKQRIGDAIRNAAMRFGVALDLWSKEELESEISGAGESSPLDRVGTTRPGTGTTTEEDGGVRGSASPSSDVQAIAAKVAEGYHQLNEQQKAYYQQHKPGHKPVTEADYTALLAVVDDARSAA